MLEYFNENMWQMWAIVAVVCLILELSSGDFFIISFSVGAVVAAIAAAVGLNFYWQLFVLAVFSLLSIFFVRPLALRYLHRNEPAKPSNADALIGRTGKVTEPISTDRPGYVQIDGDQWKAVSLSQTDISKGTTVRIVDRQSTVVTVEEV